MTDEEFKRIARLLLEMFRGATQVQRSAVLEDVTGYSFGIVEDAIYRHAKESDFLKPASLLKIVTSMASPKKLASPSERWHSARESVSVDRSLSQLDRDWRSRAANALRALRASGQLKAFIREAIEDPNIPEILRERRKSKPYHKNRSLIVQLMEMARERIPVCDQPIPEITSAARADNSRS